MDEKLLEVLEQFDLEIRNTYRGRGATICVTNEGVKILKEFHGSAGKLMDEYEFMNQMIHQGFDTVDQYVKNKQGGFFAVDRYKTTFIMKDYYEGRECDIRNRGDVEIAADNLARFHKAAQLTEVSERTKAQYQTIEDRFYKHNEEMKRTRAYIRTVRKKGEFERLYLENYPIFWNQAEQAYQMLTHLPREWKEQRLSVCHGEYNQHNVIKYDGRIATINLEHFHYQNQLLDVHQFLRKALEKNGYSMQIAEAVIHGYDGVLPLSEGDLEYLYVLLLYPEKFFKISNHYYNGKKCWIPPKNIEKMQNTRNQNEKKEMFLAEFRKQFLGK